MIQATIRNTHMPNEFENIHNVLLMRLGGEDDRRAPRPETFVNPAIGFEDVNVVGHDDLAFMRSMVRLLATDGRRGAGIDSEFEVKDRKFDASAIEAVPMRFDDVDNGGANVGCDVRADGEVLCKFGKVSFAVPYMDVGADVGERFR